MQFLREACHRNYLQGQPQLRNRCAAAQEADRLLSFRGVLVVRWLAQRAREPPPATLAATFFAQAAPHGELSIARRPKPLRRLDDDGPATAGATGSLVTRIGDSPEQPA